MRNVKFMSVLILALFMLSGCGGGSLDSPNSGENSSNNISNNNSNEVIQQIIYDAAKVLVGTWQPYERVTTEINNISVQLQEATIIISDVNISNDYGTCAMTSSQNWYSVLENINIPVKLEEKEMNIIRMLDPNSWHFTSGTGKFANIIITISQDNIITMDYEDRTSSSIAEAPNKIVSVNMNLRKRE